MKTPRLFLSLALLSPVLRLPAAPVTSSITAVTVYMDRAVVTRTASHELEPGVTELVFENLPESLLDQSLQVSGKGTAAATILDVAAKQTYVDFTPNARVKELEDQLRGFARQIRGLDDQTALLHGQRKTLDHMEAALTAKPAKDVPRPAIADLTSALTFLTDQRTRISTALAALDDQREDLQGRITAVQNQLNELRGAGGKGYKTVTVRVSAAEAGSLNLALSYTVPNARWSSSYDARVLSGAHSVELGYFGIVRQATGEDWKDVMLTLSTARPSMGGTAPVLNVWNLDIPAPDTIVLSPFEVSARQERAYAGKQTLAGTRMKAMPSNIATDGIQVQDADYAIAAVEAGATSATFKIANPASVASDNSPQKVPVMSVKLNANPEYLTVPKRLAAAFLTAKVYNSTDFPLLAGPMNVFLDGTFVATSHLRTVMPGEKFDLALGLDEGISVQYKRVSRYTEATGLTNSGKRITYEYLITVQNNRRTAERVVVADQVPLSRNEKITVKQIVPDPGEVKPTDEGTLKWTLELKPGEKRELPVKFSVEFAKDVTVTGLEP